MNPVFPVLYSRTSTGAVQVWKIIVEGGSFHTVSGQLNGKQTTSKPTVCKPKNVGKANETTAEQQAQSEAAAKHKKKIESGYKLDKDDIDKTAFVEPMLAKDFKDRQDDVIDTFAVNGKVFYQPKLDGMRCIVHKGGMFSRNGKPILSSPHIFKELQPIFKDNPDLIFDGELYADKLADDFNTLMSLAKQAKPTADDIKRSAETLEYHIYDLVDTNLKFSERHKKILDLEDDGLIDTWDTSIQLVNTEEANNMVDLNTAYENFIEEGYEGQMIRFDAPYEHKRSAYLLKRKEFITEEYEILDIIEGDGNRAGMAGYAWVKNKQGRPEPKFKSNIKGSHEFCTKLLKEKNKYIGKQATIKYFNLTPGLEVPRFPYIVEFDRQDV